MCEVNVSLEGIKTNPILMFLSITERHTTESHLRWGLLPVQAEVPEMNEEDFVRQPHRFHSSYNLNFTIRRVTKWQVGLLYLNSR